MVLDADALNVVSEHIQWLQEHKGPCIVTPHMGEMSRLTGESIATLKSDALGFAQRAAQQWQTTVVLKDARTCIADPDGRLYIHAYGNSGMATAGSGDVLTGTILGQLGACGSVTQAACMGVLLHGLAGDLAAGETGEASLMATDICRKLPEILQQYEAKGI
jgi:NAD(P)H-hydrate epimerase